MSLTVSVGILGLIRDIPAHSTL
uniref:Uncharacterized protein n=1 Tax=Amphimedon queenslandica TaxID=400682 RepID=A0A1X7U0A7_AMPQE